MTVLNQVKLALDNPTKYGHYYHNQYDLKLSTGANPPAISKALKLLVDDGLVVISEREYRIGKTSKHYCLVSRVDDKSSKAQAAHAKLLNQVELLMAQLKRSNHLPSADDYTTPSSLINEVSNHLSKSVVVEQESSILDGRINSLKSAYPAIPDDEAKEAATILIHGSTMMRSATVNKLNRKYQ